MRACAVELARTCDTEQALTAARFRLVDHYLHTGYHAERQLSPHWPPLPLPAPDGGVVAREITSYDKAMGWFTVEHTAVLAVLGDAVRHGWDAHAWQLPWVLTSTGRAGGGRSPLPCAPRWRRPSGWVTRTPWPRPITCSAVRAVFSWSYRSLSDETTAAFRALGLHPTPEFSLGVVTALLDATPGRSRRLVEALMSARPGPAHRPRPLPPARPAPGLRGGTDRGRPWMCARDPLRPGVVSVRGGHGRPRPTTALPPAAAA
ncbi:MAG TPA: hypothetical protein VNO31_00465 [Umezawaea sp.]|nr:hypothetical protein [Umezawaea sp.]